MITLIGGVSLSVIAAWFFIKPHFENATQLRTHAKNAARNRQDHLLEQKERQLQVLRDLELDYATQKLSSDEYTKLYATLAAELANTIEAVEANVVKES
jgi:hypothetical protein